MRHTCPSSETYQSRILKLSSRYLHKPCCELVVDWSLSQAVLERYPPRIKKNKKRDGATELQCSFLFGSKETTMLGSCLPDSTWEPAHLVFCPVSMVSCVTSARKHGSLVKFVSAKYYKASKPKKASLRNTWKALNACKETVTILSRMN